MIANLYIQILDAFIIKINLPQSMFSSKSLTPIDRQLNKKVVKIIHGLLMMEQSAAFRKPVPHKALGLEDYKLIVKKPTDLNLIRRQNNENKYKFLQQILDEIQLCWDNCKLYNAIGSEIYEQALLMEKSFDKFGKQFLPDYWKCLNREEYNDKFTEKKIQQEKLKKPEAKNVKRQKQKIPLSDIVIEQSQKAKIKKGYNSTIKYYQVQNEEDSSLNKKYMKQNIQAQEINEAEHQGITNLQQKQSMEIEQDQQGHQIIHNEPIMVNLQQIPTKQQLVDLSNKVKQLYQKQQYGVLQKMLQVLHSHQKQNMTLNKNSQMIFKMNNIHISTFYRLKALLAQGEQGIFIIQ